MRAIVRYLLPLLGATLLAGGAEAQVVHVRATDSATAAPLPGALASLRLGPKVVVRILTDGVGRASLAAPSPGAYQVRVDAIGYAGASTGVTLGAADTITMQVALTAKPFTLTDLVVTSDRRAICRLDNRQGGIVARMWDEARKALQATELTRNAATTLLELRTYERRLDDRRRIVTESSETRRSATSRPFQSVDPVMLHAEGYVRVVDGDTWYYGPDAELLLSDEFLGDHCFRVAGSEPSGSLIGLSFEPEPRRDLPEIAGTLWIDAKTSQLRSLEFVYVNAPLPQDLRDIGGNVEFSRMPNGAWIISEWHIRMPLLRVIKHIGSTQRDSLTGFNETGGSAVLVVAGTERTRPTSAIVGAVYDSMAGRPLAGVRVSIAGGAYRDTTDGAGRYRIESPIAGDLIVTFDHLRFAAFRLGSILRDGRLERGTIDTVNAWVPGPDFLLRSLCGTVVTADTMSLAVVGSVKAARGDTTIEVDLKWAGGGFVRRLPAGRVAVSERETVMSVSLDSAGRFVACGVPRDRPVTVTARRDRRTGEPATIPRWSPAIVELQLDRPLD